MRISDWSSDVCSSDLLTGENRHGRGYAEMAWRYSPTVAAVRKLPPNAIIFSNGPDAINYLTGRHTRFIPFLFQRRTGRDDPANPYRRQREDMAKHVHRGHGEIGRATVGTPVTNAE